MTHRQFELTSMPLDGLRLIEASAGTGKTFSLTGLYLRLLIEKQLDVRQILVMTFTRAATQELRERIRLRLDRAAVLARSAAAADPQSAEDALILSLLAASTESEADLSQRLTRAARNMDEAPITTIHGFSQQAAADNAFDSALPFDQGEAVDDREVMDEVIGDYWRGQALGGAWPGFLQCWPLPARLQQDLAPLFNRPHAQLAGPPQEQILQAAGPLRELWHDDRDSFLALWQQAVNTDALLKSAALYKGLDPDSGDPLRGLCEALDSGHPLPLLPPWARHLDDPGQLKKNAKAHQALGQTCTGHPLSAALRRWQGQAQAAALRRAYDDICAMAERRKRQRRQYSFADMIAALHRAITSADGGAALADALHRNWPWALVDEFQDTDPKQYAILRRIYGDRAHGGLCLIGDPKQAIYGFRGGDVHAYLAAVSDAGKQSYSLATNYRSSAGLLQAVEALFRQAGENTFLVDGIAFQSVAAGRDDEARLWLDSAEQAPLTIWKLPAQPSTKGEVQALCRQACLTQIQRLLGGRILTRHQGMDSHRPVVPADIAILVNSNSEAAGMQRALSVAGLGAVCLHKDSVYASREALDVLHVLRAAASPTDEDRVRAALSTELIGGRLADLVAVNRDESRWQSLLNEFQDAHLLWQQRGVLAALQGLIQAAAPRLLAYPNGERRLSNYLQLTELLAEAEGHSYGMPGLLAELQREIRDAGDDTSESRQLRLESDQALIRITTVHRAKGLEYPIVLLPYAHWLGSGAKPRELPLHYHDAAGQSLIDPVGTPETRTAAVTEARAEAMRTLYVALTRAAVACYLPWGAVNDSQNSALASLLHRDLIPADHWSSNTSCGPLNAALAESALQQLQSAAAGQIRLAPLPDSAPAAAPARPSADEASSVRADLPAVWPAWSVHSFSRLLRDTAPGHDPGGARDEALIPAPTAEPVTPDPALPELPGGTRFGEAVHSLLEIADPGQWPATGALPAAAQHAVENQLRRFGLPTDEPTHQATAELIRATWHTPLPEIGPLAALPEQARLAEMEFHFRLGGCRLEALLQCLREAGYARGMHTDTPGRLLRGLMHGFIDLTVAVGERYYVLDYKTNFLGSTPADYAADNLRHAIDAHHYDLQYLIYLTALHRHLRRRLPGYTPAKHLGGAIYLFLRGLDPEQPQRGVFRDRPPCELIEQLDRLLESEEAQA